MPVTYEEGRYRARVKEQVFGKNHNDKVCLTFVVVPIARIPNGDGDEINVEEFNLGERSISFYFASEANAKISIEQLRELGWKGTSFKELSDNSWSLVDEEKICFCVYETYVDKNGDPKQTERWRFSTSLPSQANQVKKADSRLASELDAQFGSILKGDTPATGKPTPKKGRGRPAKKLNEDEGDKEERIPF